MKRGFDWYLTLLKKHTITQLIISWVIGTIGVVWLNNTTGVNIVADAFLIVGVGLFALIVLSWVVAAFYHGISWLVKKTLKK